MLNKIPSILLISIVFVTTFNSTQLDAAETTVTKYYNNAKAAMALNYDTELYMAGMIHSMGGYNPPTAASRAQETLDGWPNIIADCESYDIPVSFNICGYEAVFGDAGRNEVNEIDVYHTWHSDSHWDTNSWYSDMPASGGNYTTVGDLSGYTRSYSLIYGGPLTEQTMNSDVLFEISYHNFGHESLSDINDIIMDATFRLGVEYHKKIGSKLTAECPPWNNNPQTSKYPIYVQNGIFVFNRSEASGDPYEVIEDLWIVSRGGAFSASTDLTSSIDTAISNGTVLAPYSHPEDGFESSSRSGFQTSLAYAKTKTDSGELWATTLSEIGRYWEAKSDANVTTNIIDGNTVVSITLDDYNNITFGIPYLTFVTSMPNDANYAKITVDYPSLQTLNSDSNTVRIVDSNVIYTIYLDPNDITSVEIQGVNNPYTGGVNINKPILTVDSNAPVDPCGGVPITIQATTTSTDAIYTVNLIYQCDGQAKDSRIMDYNDGGFWETNIGPFGEGNSISYYVSVTDNSGRRERASDKNFSTLETEAPEWRNQGQSSATPTAGSSVDLFAEGKDMVALRYATLATNETGVWEKKTAYGSPMSMGDVADTWTLSSFTWSNPAIPEGNTVSWKIYYEDASSNESVTDVMSFTLQTPDLNSPQYFDPCQSSITAGDTSEFGLRWTDNVALDGFIFSFDNGTGSFVDDSFVEFAPMGRWWDPDWDYRKEITINNTTGAETLTNYAVLVTVDTAALIGSGKMNPYCGDVRFVDSTNSEELDFWIESGINTSDTRIWVEAPNIPALSTETMYMYYGSANHKVPQSDGNDTFPVFDDFGGRGWEEFKYSSNPVMGPGSSAGGSGTFSSVIREGETSWRMYSSYYSGNSIGVSTSTDGISWTRQQVVLQTGSAGKWDASNVWCPGVWEEGGTYYMLYAATGPNGIAMGLATSPNGLDFTKYAGNPVFEDPDWAAGDTEGPCFSALKEDGTYYVMYNTLGGHRQSSIVSSTNLTDWTRVYNYPRFPGGPSTSDWNYNTFCGNVFKYEDMFYLVLPGQDSSRDYAKYGLYVSHSPAFPEDDTEFKGIVMVGNATGWENADMDTPWAVLFGDTMYMYYAACGSCWSQTGVITVDDIALALIQAYPPGNYIDIDRTASASLQIMPPVGWQKSIAGYQEINSQNFEITLDPAVTGRAVVHYDANASEPLELYKDIDSMDKATASAWIRADNNDTGDYDLYVYGDSQSTLALAAGLGGNGFFHYWNGSFVDSAVAYSADTWYLVQVEFDIATDKYNFVVYDTSFAELLRVDNIDFGATVSTGMDRIDFRTSSSFNGYGYLDDVRVRNLANTEPNSTVGSESTPDLTQAWSRVTKTLTSSEGATVRWKVSANDTSDNWTVSDIYSFVTEGPDFPPAVVLDSPNDNVWSDVNSITFTGTCTDDSNITSVSLYGDWGGSWSLIDTNSSPGLNGQPVSFTEVLPEGTWTWNFKCYDDNSQSAWGTTRTINVDTTPQTWWHSNYLYRKRLTINENSGNNLTNYPLHVTFDTASLIGSGKLQPDCNDIRVVYLGSEIPSQIIEPNSADTQIWFQIDLLASQSEYEVYVYYGNPTATAPDYSSQSSITWDDFNLIMDTGKITATFDSDGGIIGQIKHNTNNQELMAATVERGLGYLFSENPAVYYIFRVDESDDTVFLTEDGPIVKIVTAYSGESPQWVQENIFYNNQEFVDFRVYRPDAASTEEYLTGTNGITPDGVFSTSDTDELLRVDNSTSDVNVTFDDTWRYDPTNNIGYVGLVDPTFTNQLAFIWDQSYTSDFTWKPRTSNEAGAYSLFIGGNGVAATYGTIDSNEFDYRFVLNYSETPDNNNTQTAYDSYVTDPPTITLGAQEEAGVDDTPPTVTITSPISTTYSTGTIPLNYFASEATSWCGYSLNGEPNITIENCGSTTLASLSNETHELVVYATDFANNTGSNSVTFTVDVVESNWWDLSWNYRIPVSVNTVDYNRVDEPIEQFIDFTDGFTQVGQAGLTFDINSVRVIEHDANGIPINEISSQFDEDAGYDPNTNAVGTVVWIMDGVTDVNTTRYYYIYFDSVDNNKPAPVYSTDLDWNAGSKILSNTNIDTTIGSAGARSGISNLKYNNTEYLTNNGMVYIDGVASTYETLIDGPVKKTIKLTAVANGSINVTLYDLAQSVKINGYITGSGWSFTPFPYTWSLSASVCTNTLYYYDSDTIQTENVTGNNWLGHAPQEGWACYAGSGSYKDFCLVTDSNTLSKSNNLWRNTGGGSSDRQLMLPGFNPNPTFPIDPNSWIVFTDTYQDGRNFWNKLSSSVVKIQGAAEKAVLPIISGYIFDPNDKPMENVSVDANNGGGFDITDVNGFYKLWVDYNWSGTVMPQKQGYYFDPNEDAYANVLDDYTDMDFMGIRNEDINIDGFIDELDLWYIAEYWLQENPPEGDLFEDNFMNFLDFAKLAKVWLIEEY